MSNGVTLKNVPSTRYINIHITCTSLQELMRHNVRIFILRITKRRTHRYTSGPSGALFSCRHTGTDDRLNDVAENIIIL